MENKYDALVAFHDEFKRDAAERFLELWGYNSKPVETTEELYLNMANLNYKVILMDANLGNSGKIDSEPLERVCKSLADRIIKKDVTVMGSSGRTDYVENWQKKGLPVVADVELAGWIMENLPRKS